MDLSHNQKKVAAWGATFLSFVPWLLYSSPNTIYVFTRYAKGLEIFDIPNSGFIMMLTIGLAISLGEYIAMLFYIWKTKLFMIAIVICAGVSVYGSYLFFDFSQQITETKLADINLSAEKKDQWKLLIQSEMNTIKARNQQMNELSSQREQFLQRKEHLPSWIAKRARVASEEIKSANLRIKAYTDSMGKYSSEFIIKKKNTGVMIRSSKTISKRRNIFIAVFVESWLILFGFVSIGCFNSVVQDRLKGRVENKQSGRTYKLKTSRKSSDKKPYTGKKSDRTQVAFTDTPKNDTKGVYVYGTPEVVSANDVYGKLGTPDGTIETSWVEVFSNAPVPMDVAIEASKKRGNVPDPVIVNLRLTYGWGYDKIRKEAAVLLERPKPYAKSLIQRILKREGLVR